MRAPSAAEDRAEPTEHVLSEIERLRYPTGLSLSRDGTGVAVSVFPAYRDKHRGFESRIWLMGRGKEAVPLTEGPGTDTLPRFSPADDRIAFASDRALPGKLSLYLMTVGSEPKQVGDIPGTIEDIRWTGEGTALVALAADPEADAAAVDGAQPLRWGGADEGPAVTTPAQGWRRLYLVDLETGATEEVGPGGISVWDFDLIDGARAVAIVSVDPSERGYYRAHLAELDFESRRARELYRPEWQIQSPAVSADGRRVAFVEGWSSDRWLVCGEIRTVDIDSGEPLPFVSEVDDVTTVQWRDEESLWFAGWEELGSHYGVVGDRGEVRWRTVEDATIGPNGFVGEVTPAPDGSFLVGIREAIGQAPEVMTRDAGSDGDGWTPLSNLNGEVASQIEYPEIREIAWEGADGLPLRGFVMLPVGGQEGPHPLIVNVHGGPTWAWRHGFDPGHSLPFATAGYAVFLPNYRGNAGWGQGFARSNVGDPGGKEFEDILRGIDACVTRGVAEEGRIGITGGSYGGYLTAWAVTTSDRFAAGVMVAGIANLISAHLSCNHAFFEFIAGASPYDRSALELYVGRSPVTHARGAHTPTLIIHGLEDRCTPVGQGHELYAALMENGVDVELAVYPREGHGLRERDHQRDAVRRTLEWFDRHLG